MGFKRRAGQYVLWMGEVEVEVEVEPYMLKSLMNIEWETMWRCCMRGAICGNRGA
jgi:hypothetical protein